MFPASVRLALPSSQAPIEGFPVPRSSTPDPVGRPDDFDNTTPRPPQHNAAEPRTNEGWTAPHPVGGYSLPPHPGGYSILPPGGYPVPPPAPPSSAKPFYKKSWVLVVATIVAVVGASAAGIAVINEMTERAERADCADRVIAHAKYPGGAEISDMRKASKFLDDDDTATYSHGYRGEADFPNGFGVPVRMYFFCKVTPMGTMDVTVDEDFFI